MKTIHSKIILIIVCVVFCSANPVKLKRETAGSVTILIPVNSKFRKVDQIKSESLMMEFFTKYDLYLAEDPTYSFIVSYSEIIPKQSEMCDGLADELPLRTAKNVAEASGAVFTEISSKKSEGFNRLAGYINSKNKTFFQAVSWQKGNNVQMVSCLCKQDDIILNDNVLNSVRSR